MCEGDERERDRALVATAERYLESSQERPALLEDGFRAAVRLWRHYEGVVKTGWEKLASPGTDDRSAVLMRVAAAADELSKALSAFGEVEGLLAAIRGITSGGELSITFYVCPTNARLDVCVQARSGMEDSDRVNISANSAKVAEVLRRLEREVLEGVASALAAGGSSELEDALEEEERADPQHFDPRRGLKIHEEPAPG